MPCEIKRAIKGMKHDVNKAYVLQHDWKW